MADDHDAIDEKLARLGRRVRRDSQTARDRMARQGWLAEAEGLRETFGAKLTHHTDADGELGTRPVYGQRSNINLTGREYAAKQYRRHR